MVRIKYKLIRSSFLGGEALILCGIDDGLHDTVFICFDGIKNGTLQLGDNAYTVNNSTATIDYSLFPDGAITPEVTIGKRTVKAMPIVKWRDGIYTVSDVEGNAKLLSLCLELESRLTECENALNELSVAVHGNTLFDFIENKKG